MTDFTPVNMIGQENSTGDVRKLHKDMYAAEVLTKFHSMNVTAGRHVNKTLKGGKSFKFPVFGPSKGATVHKAGTRIVPKQVKRSELTISLDERLYTAIFLDELDEIMSDVDARSIYTEQQAANLAEAKDKTILRLMVKAARSAGLLDGLPGGSRLVDAGFRTDAHALVKGILDAKAELKRKNVDLSTAVAFITPAQEALLILNRDSLNRDYGGEGSFAAGTIPRIGGIELVVTNNLPCEDLSTDASIAAAGYDAEEIFDKYRADYSKVAAIVATKNAVATVTAIDLDVRFVEERDSYGELIATSYAYGGGVYRPECAVELHLP